MAPPRWPTVETIRYAAKRAVARSSLRKVAAEMEMAVSWLNAFVEGKDTALRAQTKRNLREWYVRNARDLAEQDVPTAVAALFHLTGGVLDETERRQAYSRLLQNLARIYADAGPLPAWIRDLLAEDQREER